MPWALFVLFAIMCTGAVAGGIIYSSHQKKTVLEQTRQELMTIADLKVRQITEWRRERISDGQFLGSNISMVRDFKKYLNNPGDKKLREEISVDLKSLLSYYDYRNALFVDRQTNVILFYPDQDTVIGAYLKPKLPGFMEEGKVVLTDFHQTGKVSFRHLDLLVPLAMPGDTGAFGAVLLRIDPQNVLYPIIKSWPVSSKTAESLIFHRDGDELVYLNELRHAEGSELSLRIPVSTDNLPAALALRGIRFTTDGVDYRGVPVIAAMSKIPESPWYLVAKIDREELFADLYRLRRMITFVVLLVLLTTGLLTGFLWWNQRVRFYRGKYEKEVERLALVRHYEYILKHANDIILLSDSNYIIVEANEKALELYGYDRDEIIGKSIHELRTPETVMKINDDLRDLNERGNATFETIHKRKDGSTFPIEISARKFDIEGTVFFQSISRDITDRKVAEEILRESEERFRKLFEESPVGMVMTGKDMGIMRANPSFCKMIGYPEDEILGHTFRHLTHPDSISHDEVGLLNLVAKKIPVYRTEKRYLTKSGSVIWGSTTVVIIRNNREEVQFFFAMIEDITFRKAAEADLIAAKEKAEESDRLKTAFLHNVSHEIRTPMNAILGFSNLLSDPEVSPDDRKQFTDIIIQSGNQLLSIINDIVDLASIESGQVKVTASQINLNTTLRQISEQYSIRENHHKIALSLITPLPQKEAEIITDKTKLIQIVSNLINNAFKFTEKGKISFGYAVKDKSLEFFV
ncbi:MAG: PAS domain S-box protein, partial [Bacteroidales bacterium]|nr:PAS domain S-box protein [Bacteroidales bacterium]